MKILIKRTVLYGFTLAEVLITLAIIGVVASLTIPTLVVNYQKKQYTTQLEHFISDFNNALGLIKNDMNCSDLACTGIWDSTDESTGAEIWTKLKATGRLHIIKDCGLSANEGCFSSSETYLNGDSVASSATVDSNTTIAKGVLANGVSISMWDDGGNCSNSWAGNTGSVTEMCGPMTIDINGPAKPNIWGRDLFHLRITNKGGVLPYGINLYPSSRRWDYPSSASCDLENYSASHGTTCAARILEQGWQMNY